MAEGQIGEFYHRFPDRRELHRNQPGQPLYVLGCHEHGFGHIRILFAGDQPGPDGRVGWWEKAWSPVYDEDGKKIGRKLERDNPVRANGTDSVVWIPANWEHEFTLLSMSGYHDCIHHNWEPVIDETGKTVSWKIVPYFTGYVDATR